jgi:hypothetical protein
MHSIYKLKTVVRVQKINKVKEFKKQADIMESYNKKLYFYSE